MRAFYRCQVSTIEGRCNVAGSTEPAAGPPPYFDVSDATIVYYDLVRMNDNATFNISLDCSGITTNVSAVIVWCVLE